MFGADRDRSAFPELHAAGACCFQELLDAAAELLEPDATDERVRAVALTAWSVHGFATLWNDGPMAMKYEGAELEDLVERLLATLFAGFAPRRGHLRAPVIPSPRRACPVRMETLRAVTGTASRSATAVAWSCRETPRTSRCTSSAG